jgi:hypothetical protein
LQTSLNYRAQQTGTSSGIVPALSSSAQYEPNFTRAFDLTDRRILQNVNYTTLAHNLIFASSEAQRIAYEIATMNVSRIEKSATYDVDGLVTQQICSITYVPAILLLGPLSLSLAAVIMPAAMAFYTRHTHLARMFREVDATRLVVDTVKGLGDEINAVSGRQVLPNEKLEKWADHCLVGYVQMGSGGVVEIDLRQEQ